MTITELGAIGELIGGVAVVGSLLFVGLQIRHNSASIEQTGKVAGGTMHQETNRSYADFFRLIAENSDLASIYCKGRQGAELDPIEVARYEALLEVHFAWLEVNHTQEKLGFRGELAEATTLEITGPFSRQLLTGSYAKEWWERDARYQYVPDFYREATPIVLGERGA